MVGTPLPYGMIDKEAAKRYAYRSRLKSLAIKLKQARDCARELTGQENNWKRLNDMWLEAVNIHAGIDVRPYKKNRRNATKKTNL